MEWYSAHSYFSLHMENKLKFNFAINLLPEEMKCKLRLSRFHYTHYCQVSGVWVG